MVQPEFATAAAAQALLLLRMWINQQPLNEKIKNPGRFRWGFLFTFMPL